MKIPLFALALCLISFNPAWAEYAHPEEKVQVTAVANTYSKALYLSQDQAVQTISGTYFQTHTGVRNFQMVQPLLMKDYHQFLRDFQPLKTEALSSGHIRLTADYKVQVAELTRRLDQILAQLAEQKQRTRVLVVTENAYSDHLNEIRAGVESALIGWHYQVLASDGVDTANLRREQILSGVSPNQNPSWRQAARQLGADLVVHLGVALGNAELKDQQVVKDKVVKPGYYQAQGKYRCEILEVATGRKLSHHLLYLQDTAPERLALQRKLSGRAGTEFAAWTNDSLVAFFLKAQGQPQQARFLLSGIQDYLREGQAFLTLLKAQPGVSDVAEVSFSQGQMEVTLLYQGPRLDLEQSLIAQLSSQPALGRLNKISGAGQTSHFLLVPPPEKR